MADPESEKLYMSTLVSSVLRKTINEYALSTTTHMSVDDEETLRSAYLKIIESPDWVATFTETGRALISEQMKITPPAEGGPGPSAPEALTIAVNKQLYSFSKEVVLIGRKQGNDIKLPDPGVSRLHVLIFLLPSEDMYLVVDIGSLCGFRTLARSGEGPLYRSKPQAREVGIFKWRETATIQMENLTFAFNPKDCVVCLENKRGVTFDCGHHVVCEACNSQLEKCPICRAVIHARDFEFAVMTAPHHRILLTE